MQSAAWFPFGRSFDHIMAGSDTYKTYRHSHAYHVIIPISLTVIADLVRNPEVRRPGRQQANTTYRIPSPLMGEESKVRVIARQSHHTVIPA